MQRIVWDLGRFIFSLVDPVLRTLLRSSTPLRFAQDDTRGLCSHKSVGVGASHVPICFSVRVYVFSVTSMSLLCKNTTKLMPSGVIFFYCVSFLTKFLLKNRVK